MRPTESRWSAYDPRAPLARAILALAALPLAGSVAAAHDFWLEPSSFRPAAGSVLTVTVLQGHPGEAEPYARKPAHIRRFELIGSGEEPLLLVGRAGADPAGTVRLPESSVGTLVLVYHSNPTSITLEPKKFEEYLEEKGLDHVLRTRRDSGSSADPGRERFERCARSLVRSGTGSGGGDKPVGLPLELLTLAPEEGVVRQVPAFQLLFEGKPLKGCLVELQSLAGGAPALRARTDESGRALFEVRPDGEAWLVSAVHMIPDEDQAESDWHSYWATLTLAAPRAEAVGVDGPSAGK